MEMPDIMAIALRGSRFFGVEEVTWFLDLFWCGYREVIGVVVSTGFGWTTVVFMSRHSAQYRDRSVRANCTEPGATQLRGQVARMCADVPTCRRLAGHLGPCTDPADTSADSPPAAGVHAGPGAVTVAVHVAPG